MDRKEYTNCMVPYMRGGGPDRKERFCIGAKICSKKAANEQEAAKLCAEAAANPKPPKPKGVRRGKIDTATLAACVIKGLDGAEISLATLTPIIASCTGQKVTKPLTQEGFIKKCFKENMVTGDMKEAQKLRTMCAAQWKEKEAGSEAR